MKGKKVGIILCVCILGIIALGAYGEEETEIATNVSNEESTEQVNDSENNESQSSESQDNESESSVKQVGEPIPLSDGDGGKMTLTITEWGAQSDNLSFGTFSFNRVLYVAYEVENTGNKEMTVSNGLFDIYADDYAVEQTYGDDYSMLTDIAPGRKVSAKLYGDVDPDSAKNIEIQLNNVLIALKGDNVTQEGINNQLLTSDEVNYVSAAAEQLSEISGLYRNTNKSSEVINVSMYSSPEENVVGTAQISYGSGYEGELIEIKTNVYQLICDETDPIILSFTQDYDGTIIAHVYRGLFEITKGVMVEKFES